MKMRRFIALLIISVLACTALVSCGKTDMDTGVMSVTAPSGWGVCKRTIDGSEKDDQIYVIKDGETQTDTMGCPNILVSYYKNASEYTETNSFFKDSADVSPIKAGDKTWEGYTYTDFGTPSACLMAKDGNALFVCVIVLEKGDSKISLDDDDVKSVLESIKTN